MGVPWGSMLVLGGGVEGWGPGSQYRQRRSTLQPTWAVSSTRGAHQGSLLLLLDGCWADLVPSLPPSCPPASAETAHRNVDSWNAMGVRGIGQGLGKGIPLTAERIEEG